MTDSHATAGAGQPALIFDFGNVVAFFDYARACEVLGRPLGQSGPELLATARAGGLAEVVKAYEAGQIPAEEFGRRFGALIGREVPHPEFAAAWSDIFWANEPVATLVHWLADRGHTLVLGSNTNPLHAAQFRRQFAGTLGRFHGLVLSYEVGHNKPAPEFYAACVAAAGREPADCIFIDDLPENVEAARAAGLQGLVYRADEHARLLAELAALGIAVPPA